MLLVMYILHVDWPFHDTMTHFYLHTFRPSLGGGQSCNRSGAEFLLAATPFTMVMVRAGFIDHTKWAWFLVRKVLCSDLVKIRRICGGMTPIYVGPCCTCCKGMNGLLLSSKLS